MGKLYFNKMQKLTLKNCYICDVETYCGATHSKTKDFFCARCFSFDIYKKIPKNSYCCNEEITENKSCPKCGENQ